MSEVRCAWAGLGGTIEPNEKYKNSNVGQHGGRNKLLEAKTGRRQRGERERSVATHHPYLMPRPNRITIHPLVLTAKK